MSEPTESTPSRPGSPVGALPSHFNAPRPYRFNWDSSLRRPGPESVSGTTEGRGQDYITDQPQLGFLNTSTASLALGALPSEWSSSRHGFHAISTVLNNPHKRQAPPKAHSALPAVPPAVLPRVRRKDFNSYLNNIAPEWQRFERNLQIGREGEPQDDEATTPRPSFAAQDNMSPSSIRSPLSTIGRSMPPLNTVPPVFFDPKFNLGDPHTFALVTEQSGHQNTAPGASHTLIDPSTLAHSLPLLEKFSHYADTVEQHLVREISLRSTSFFAALTNLQELQTESEQCLDRITRLRALLRDVDENSAKRGLQIVRRECKMSNISKVREGVGVVKEVVEMSAAARQLVTAGQWSDALGVIERIERLWDVAGYPPSTETPPVQSAPPRVNGRPSTLASTPEEEQPLEQKKPFSMSLQALKAFSALPTHLHSLSLEIASTLATELVSTLRLDLSRFMDEKAMIRDEKPNLLNQVLAERLTPLLYGLARTHGLKEATLSWKEAVMEEIRTAIARNLPTIEAENDASPSASSLTAEPSERPGLGNHLRNMPHADFMLVLQAIFRSLLSGIGRLQAQSLVIVESLHSIQIQQTYISRWQEEFSDILSSAAELANTQAAKVVSFRAEQHAALALPDFMIFFKESWEFVVQCEVICRRMIVGLRGVVVSQAKSFLQGFHEIRISQSAKSVQEEQWVPVDISPSLQHVADIILDSAVRDAPELVISSEAVETGTLFVPSNHPPPEPTPSPSAPAHTQNGLNVPAPTGSKRLRIEDRTYYAVSATTEVLMLLMDYLRVVVNLSMLTTDTMSRVIEFLKAFNSRTCQVVLGGGAVHSAGLKMITARHLALASQSLSIMFELVPYIREAFRRHLSQTQAVMLVEFDKLKRDLQEHQNEIHAKLIAIMGFRLSVHIQSLQGIDWNAAPTGNVNKYMEVLVKETTTLHKVLSRFLATTIVEYVMTQVYAAINHRLSEEYSTIQLPNQGAKDRLLADARFLHQTFSTLKNVGTPSMMLETILLERSLPRAQPPQPPPTRSNTLQNVSSNANQRLRGLLAPTRTATTVPTPAQGSIPSQPLSPFRSLTSLTNGINGNMPGGSTSSLVTTSSLDETSTNARVSFQETEVSLPPGKLADLIVTAPEDPPHSLSEPPPTLSSLNGKADSLLGREPPQPPQSDDAPIDSLATHTSSSSTPASAGPVDDTTASSLVPNASHSEEADDAKEA